MQNVQPAFDLLRLGKIAELRQLIQAEISVAEFRDATGVSLLMHCLYRGQRELAEVIAAEKRDLDLFEATALGRLDLLQPLLADAQAINSHSADGFTALHFACFFGQPEAGRLLIDNGAALDARAANPMQVMPLHSAASARNLPAARLLLEHGAPVDARQHGGWIPLHSAAQNGDLPMVELLLKHHSDPRLGNDDGKTPARVARENGHEEIARLLDQTRADSITASPEAS